MIKIPLKTAASDFVAQLLQVAIHEMDKSMHDKFERRRKNTENYITKVIEAKFN